MLFPNERISSHRNHPPAGILIYSDHLSSKQSFGFQFHSSLNFTINSLQTLFSIIRNIVYLFEKNIFNSSASLQKLLLYLMKVEIKDGNFFYSQDIPSFFLLIYKEVSNNY